MPDYSFISRPPENSGLRPIADILGIAGQAQALQSGQQNIQRGGIALQKERELLQPQIEQGKALSETAVTESQTRKLDLAKQQAQAAYNEVAGLFKNDAINKGDVPGSVEALLDAQERAITRGVPKPIAGMIFGGLISKAQQPGALPKAINDIIQAQAGPASQASVVNAPVSPVSTGGQVTFQQLQPGAPGAVQPGQSMPVTMGPGSLETIEQDAAGNKHVVSRSPQGSILSTRPVPGTAGPSAGPRGFTAFSPGQAGEIADSQKEVAQLRQQADQAPTIRHINREILNLSKDTKTGPGTEKWQTALGSVAAAWGGNVSNYQELGKYLEQNAIRNMQAMGGPPSDARLAAAVHANGSTAFNPEALQAVTKFNDATTTALQKYREGLDRAIGTEGANYAAVPTFKNAWSKAFDVDVFALQNALENKDTAEINKILGKKDGKTTAESIRRAKELAEKRRALNALVNGG